MVAHRGQRPAGGGAIDPYPPAVGLKQRCPGGRGPFQCGFVNLGAIDDNRPIDQGVAAETSIGFGDRRRRTAHRRLGRRQLAGGEQRDVRRLEFVHGFKHRRGTLDLQPNTRRLGRAERGRDIAQRRDRQKARPRPKDRVRKHPEKLGLTREIQGKRGLIPHVTSGAPPTRIVAIGELDRQRPYGLVRVIDLRRAISRHGGVEPRVERYGAPRILGREVDGQVGHQVVDRSRHRERQPQANTDERLTGRSRPQPFEPSRHHPHPSRYRLGARRGDLVGHL